MAKLTVEQRQYIADKMSDDASRLGKLYKSFKSEDEIMSIPPGMVDEQVKEGWEVLEIKKTTVKIKRKNLYNNILNTKFGVNSMNWGLDV